MLPESLSNGLCSLNPEVDRLVLVCDMVIPASGAKAGTVTAYQFYNAVMYSHARTTHTNIWAALQQPGGPAAHAMRSVMPQVQHLYELYQLLAQGRKKRGAIDFDTVETKIVCNELGRIEQIAPSVRNDAHKLIEECMLAANTCAADFMTRSKHPGLYRIHEGPTPERLQSLREFLRTMGLSTLGGAKRPRPRTTATSWTACAAVPITSCCRPCACAPCSRPSTARTISGHFGLAYPGYSHFTSPIRRYPDLLTHRVIKALLAGQRYVPSLDDHAVVIGRTQREHEHAIWEKLGLMLSACERRADEASRDVEAWLSVLVRQGARGRGLQRHGHGRGQLRHLRHAGYAARRRAGACVGTGRRVLPVQRCAARAARRHRHALPPDRQGAGAGVARGPGSAPHRVPPGPGHQLRRLAQGGGARPDDGSRRVKKAAALSRRP